jgi:hypothetical protein
MVTDADNMDVRIKGTPLLVGRANENGFEADINAMSVKNTVKSVTIPTEAVPTYAQTLQKNTSNVHTKPKITAEQLWMLRLGFPNPERMLKLAKEDLATGVKISPATKAEDFKARSTRWRHTTLGSHRRGPTKWPNLLKESSI